MENEKRMYVIVRNDLSASYKMVQGTHALAEFALLRPAMFKSWGNGYLIFVAVPNLIALREFLAKSLTYYDAQFFCEPDLDGQLTAVCYYGDGELVANLPLA
jgi:hypothetical protein